MSNEPSIEKQIVETNLQWTSMKNRVKELESAAVLAPEQDRGKLQEEIASLRRKADAFPDEIRRLKALKDQREQH